MTYQFKIIDNLEQNPQLIEQWAQLQEGCYDQNFYHDWRWNNGLKKHLLPELRWIVCLKKEALIAVLPFEYNQETNVISLPVHSQIDLVDLVIKPTHCTPNWFSSLLSFFDDNFIGWCQFSIRPALESSAIFKLHTQHRGLKHFDPYLKNASFDVCESISLKMISKKHLKNVGRLQRKLEKEQGELRFSHGIYSDQDVTCILEIENKSWKGAQGENTSVLLDPNLEAFYRFIAAEFSTTDDCYLSLCRLGDETIAGQFALRSSNRLSLVKISYDPDYQNYAPGNILLSDTLAYTAHGPLNEVNLVTGPDWADRWHPQVQMVHWLTFYRANTSGYVAWLKAQTKDSLRPILAKFKNKAALS
ncbi:GNAT family N-acetyltransferase [Reinekea sp.]|jgi:hypothetical protein|uniref:GNAT family N-acetyltransferase n=1 Tax=Reinekea sp. TaxID=1970455 RepID=UPI003988B96C